MGHEVDANHKGRISSVNIYGRHSTNFWQDKVHDCIFIEDTTCTRRSKEAFASRNVTGIKLVRDAICLTLCLTSGEGCNKGSGFDQSFLMFCWDEQRAEHDNMARRIFRPL